MEEKQVKKKLYNIDIVCGIFCILVFIGKLIRYSIMKNVLVENGVGHYFINPILSGRQKFSLFDLDSMTNDAGGNAIVIFRIINFFKLNTYTGWEIYISIIWNIFLLIILLRVKQKLDWKQFGFVAISVIVLNLFDFTLAKEPIQMLYFILIYYILCIKNINDKWKFVLVCVVILFSAVTFRVYYLLVLMFTIAIKTLCEFLIFKKEKVKIKDIIFMIGLLGLLYFIFLNIVKVVMPEQFNELIRVRTRISQAASDMRNIFKSKNLMIFTLDYLIMIIRMMCPLELCRMGIKYIPYVIYQIIITFFVVKALKNIKNNSKEKNIALYAYLGFLLASATFEPDFGSWVRHEAVVFPILLFIADIKEVYSKKIGEDHDNSINN